MPLLSPPRPIVATTGLPRYVYTINHRHTYFGIHLPTRKGDVDCETSHTCVLAFVDRNSASYLANKLCRHRAVSKTWPERVMTDKVELLLQSCPGEPVDNPVEVQQKDADELLKELSMMEVFLGVIDEVEDVNGNMIFRSRNARLIIENDKKVKKLDTMFLGD